MEKLEKQYKALPLEERLELALSEELPDQYRPFMVHEQWMVVKCYFSRRADLTLAEVNELLGDQDHVIRLCLAKRPDLTPQMVARCVNDPDPNVRHAIARNPLITDTQKQLLQQDEDELVSRAAKKAPRAAQYRQREGQTKLVK